VRRKLIVNADDFGLTAGVCAGILRCLETGAVTSTSAMVCDPAARRRLGAARGDLEGRCGVHLQLTDGVSLTGVVFPRFPAALGAVDPAAVRREWRAQVEAFHGCGFAPAHIDTHHHVHSIPAVFDVYCEIAREFSLPARTLDPLMTRELRSRGVACPDLFAELNAESLAAVAARLFAFGAALAEIGCHPAVVDEELERASVYVSPRGAEMEALCAPDPRDRLAAMGVELAAYRSP
jgi:predicted glycoside hydrolase/deacetylase ChbG (UPF0249 family)